MYPRPKGFSFTVRFTGFVYVLFPVISSVIDRAFRARFPSHFPLMGTTDNQHDWPWSAIPVILLLELTLPQ